MTGVLSSLVTGDDTILIEPARASLGELQLTNRLQMIRVEGDVLGVAERLRRIDPGLKLIFDKNAEWEDGRGKGIYVLYHVGLTPEGHVKDTFVGAYKELDQRICNLIERLDNQGRGRYDLQTELDALERQRDREEAARHMETFGPIAEQLRFALRKDLGETGSSVQMNAGQGIRRAREDTKAAPNRAARRAAARRGQRVT